MKTKYIKQASLAKALEQEQVYIQQEDNYLLVVKATPKEVYIKVNNVELVKPLKKDIYFISLKEKDSLFRKLVLKITEEITGLCLQHNLPFIAIHNI